MSLPIANCLSAGVLMVGWHCSVIIAIRVSGAKRRASTAVVRPAIPFPTMTISAHSNVLCMFTPRTMLNAIDTSLYTCDCTIASLSYSHRSSSGWQKSTKVGLRFISMLKAAVSAILFHTRSIYFLHCKGGDEMATTQQAYLAQFINPA